MRDRNTHNSPHAARHAQPHGAAKPIHHFPVSLQLAARALWGDIVDADRARPPHGEA